MTSTIIESKATSATLGGHDPGSVFPLLSVMYSTCPGSLATLGRQGALPGNTGSAEMGVPVYERLMTLYSHDIVIYIQYMYLQSETYRT